MAVVVRKAYKSLTLFNSANNDNKHSMKKRRKMVEKAEKAKKNSNKMKGISIHIAKICCIFNKHGEAKAAEKTKPKQKIDALYYHALLSCFNLFFDGAECNIK